MDLSKVIAVSGKPGLFEVVSQAKNSFIARDLDTGKKCAIPARLQVSLLNNVSIFTTEEDIPLEEVFKKIYQKENGKESISHKEDIEELQIYLESVLPNYDKSRVYTSDIKKIFQWYNLLQKQGMLEDQGKEGEDEKKKDEKKVKKLKEAE